MANILWYGDGPSVPTGFGRVSKHHCLALKTAGHVIDVIGVNYYGIPYNQQEVPFRTIPAHVPPGEYDVYGRGRLLQMIQTVPKLDIVVVFNDPYLYSELNPVTDQPWAVDFSEAAKKKGVKIIHYFPVDGSLEPEWLLLAQLADASVTYCEYGRAEVLKHDVALANRLFIAGHGVDFDIFRPDGPRGQKVRASLLKAGKTHLGLCVATNNARKDWLRLVQILAELKKEEPRVAFYCHVDPRVREDTQENIPRVAQLLGLEVGIDILFPARYQKPLHDMELAELYRASDFHLTTTCGEGWGMPAGWEAVACGTPTVLPRVSAYEHVPPDVCWPIRAGGDDPDLWRVYPTICDVPRPMCSVKSGVEQVLGCLRGKDEREARVTRGLNWVKEFTWARASAGVVQAVREVMG